MAASKLCFSIRKEFLEKEVSEEIAFELIRLFHVQIQEPTSVQLLREYLSFLQNLFIVTKFLKQKVDDDLSICMNEHSSCGLYNQRYKDLSMSHDQKLMTLLPQVEV